MRGLRLFGSMPRRYGSGSYWSMVKPKMAHPRISWGRMPSALKF